MFPKEEDCDCAKLYETFVFWMLHCWATADDRRPSLDCTYTPVSTASTTSPLHCNTEPESISCSIPTLRVIRIAIEQGHSVRSHTCWRAQLWTLLSQACFTLGTSRVASVRRQRTLRQPDGDVASFSTQGRTTHPVHTRPQLDWRRRALHPASQPDRFT